MKKIYGFTFIILALLGMSGFLFYQKETYMFRGLDPLKAGLLNETAAIKSLLVQNNITDYEEFFNTMKNGDESINLSQLLYKLTGKDFSNGINDNFKLRLYNKKCFYFSIEAKKFGGKEKYLPKLARNENFSRCDVEKSDLCYFFFTEKGLLIENESYNCK